MPNYCVYGLLSDQVVWLAQELQGMIPQESLHYPIDPDDPFHATVFYGPYIEDYEKEIPRNSTAETVDALLGGFITKYKPILPMYVIMGVGVFDNEEFSVIKLNIESQTMTNMHGFLRDNTTNTYDKMERETPNNEGYRDPPINWCHVTLAYVTKDVDAYALARKLESTLMQSGMLYKVQQVKELVLMGAHSNGRVKALW